MTVTLSFKQSLWSKAVIKSALGLSRLLRLCGIPRPAWLRVMVGRYVMRALNAGMSCTVMEERNG